MHSLAGMVIAVGYVPAAGPPAIAEVRFLGIAHGPPAIGVLQRQNGRCRLQIGIEKPCIGRGADTDGAAAHHRTRLDGADPARIGSADCPGRGRTIASAQAHAVNLADHRISTDAAELSRNLAGASPLKPHLLQVRYPCIGPVFGSSNVVCRHKYIPLVT
jgi:xanthosine utilization system XapX-like protein